MIVGSAPTTTIDGKGGNDLICGLAGNDHHVGGLGNDQVDGGTGDDLSSATYSPRAEMSLAAAMIGCSEAMADDMTGDSRTHAGTPQEAATTRSSPGMAMTRA